MIDLAEKEVEKYQESMGQARLQESSLEASSRLRGVEVIKVLLPRLKKYIQSRQARTQEGEELLDADLFREFLYHGFDDVEEALSAATEVAVTVAELELAGGIVRIFREILSRASPTSSYSSGTWRWPNGTSLIRGRSPSPAPEIRRGRGWR